MRNQATGSLLEDDINGGADLITLAQAARLIPTRRGRKVAGTTLWRWAKFGTLGIRLEAVRRPSGDYLTTKAAVVRFLAAISLAQERGERGERNGTGGVNATARMTEARRREFERMQRRTDDVLERFGLEIGGGGLENGNSEKEPS